MKFPKILKRWWFWTATIVVILVAGSFLLSGEPEVSYVTETVELGSLTQTVDSSGEVVSVDEVELSFDLSGTVDQVLVSVGDVVEPNDLLVVLDTTELIADVQSAYQAVQVAQANLDLQRAGSSDEAVAVSSTAVDRAQAALDASEVDVETATTLLELIETQYDLSVETASDNYSQTQTDTVRALSDAYDDLLSAAWAGVVEVRSGLSQADVVLGVRDGFSNDDYETILSAQDSSALAKAKNAFYSAESSTLQAEASMSAIGYSSADSSIYSAALDVAEALDDIAVLLLYTRQVVDATPTSSSFTATSLATLKSSVDAVRTTVQVDQSALENAFQALGSASDSYNSSLEDASNALAEAQAARDYQVTSATQTLASAVATQTVRTTELAQAQASLSQTKAEPRTVDLASYEAEVERARAAYASASARLENAEIRTPIAGIVTDVALEVGEQVVAANPIITVQTTEDQFEIHSDISESDIAKLELQDEVILTFDAFGDDVEITGFVGEIDPAEKLQEGVVYYEITVYLDSAEQAVSLRPGMSADLEISTDNKDEVLSIPQRAVLEDDAGKYVRVLVNEVAERRDVETGLKADMGRVEIISGLEAGDEVIIREIDG